MILCAAPLECIIQQDATKQGSIWNPKRILHDEDQTRVCKIIIFVCVSHTHKHTCTHTTQHIHKHIHVLFDLCVSQIIDKTSFREEIIKSLRAMQDKHSRFSPVVGSDLVDHSKVPSELQCPMCKKLFTDVVVTPCCGESYCDECKLLFFAESWYLIFTFLF